MSGRYQGRLRKTRLSLKSRRTRAILRRRVQHGVSQTCIQRSPQNRTFGDQVVHSRNVVQRWALSVEKSSHFAGGEVERGMKFLEACQQTFQIFVGNTNLLCHRQHALHAERRPVMVVVGIDMLQNLPDELAIMNRPRPHGSGDLQHCE